MKNKNLFSNTSIGYSHTLKNTACEDASSTISKEDYDAFALADGHGAGYCFRSSIGSRLAVSAGIAAFSKCMEEAGDHNLAGILKSQEEESFLFSQLAKVIVQAWNESVENDLINNPVTFKELANAHITSLDKADLKDDHLSYGTTLLAGAVNEDICIFAQQGDGRIVVLYKDGSMNMPVPWDGRCYRNVTTSLCDKDAVESMRFAWIDLKERPVAAIFLMSDGFEDSYMDFDEMYDALMLATARYIQDKEGFQSFLEERLPKISMEKSADDISMICWFDDDNLKNLEGRLLKKDLFLKLKRHLDEITKELHSLMDEQLKIIHDPQKKEEVDRIKEQYEKKRAEYTQIRAELEEISAMKDE